MRIAFYAPLKAPDAPTPSGDRAMARLLIEALRFGGHTVELASRLRAATREPDDQRLADLRTEAARQAARLTAGWRDARPSERPDVWLTYHPYHKSPDLLGPAVTKALGIGYATAEASHAARRSRDAWREWQAASEPALQAAGVHFCFTARDAFGLAALLGSAERVVALPPFLDVRNVSDGPRTPSRDGSQAGRLLAVAMMRPGVKVDSYGFLARALARLDDLPWHLTLVGDGAAREAVVAAFGGVDPRRLTWAGLLSPEAVSRELARADLYVWPGFGEAYGMGYLEAQAAGVPVVALDCGGVASTLLPGRTGLLVADADLDGYADAIRSLLLDPPLRLRMGAAAGAFVRGERSLARASAILGEGLARAVRIARGGEPERARP